MTPRSPRQPPLAGSPIEMATPKRPKSPMRGLSIVRGPDTDGRWYWRYRSMVDGQLLTLWAGWASASQAKAEAIAAAAAPSSRGAVEDPRPRTVRELLRLWLRAQAERVTEDRAGQLADQIRPATLAGYTAAARMICPPPDLPRHGSTTDLGDIVIAQLAEEHLRRFRDGSGLAPGTARQALLVLRAAWRWARERGLVERDLPRVATSGRTVRAKPTPTPGEAAELLGRLDGRYRLAILLLATTGARIGEIAALTAERLRLDGRAEIMLWGKGREPRWVPLLPEVAAELRAWLADRAEGRRVDPQPGLILGVTPRSLGTGLSRVLTADLGDGDDEVRLTPHAFRRMASSTLFEHGVGPAAYEALMGHSYAMGLAAYAQAGAEQRQAASELLALPRGQVLPFAGTATGTGPKKRG